MRLPVIALLLLLVSTCVKAQQPVLHDVYSKTYSAENIEKASVSVFLFLAPDCPLCQKYTLTINALQQEFSTQNVRFYAVFPGKTFKADSIKSFAKKYNITMPLLVDADYAFTHLTGATVTPQAIIIDNKLTQRYSGKIDNWYQTIGTRRTVITEFYLKDAINALLQSKPVKVAKTKPVGCFIF